MKAVAERDMRGNWKCDTRIELDATRTLKISTHKVHSGSVVTSATVCKREGMFESHVMYQDYSQRMSVNQYKRYTAKQAEEQHNAALEVLDVVVACAKAHYNIP